MHAQASVNIVGVLEKHNQEYYKSDACVHGLKIRVTFYKVLNSTQYMMMMMMQWGTAWQDAAALNYQYHGVFLHAICG